MDERCSRQVTCASSDPFARATTTRRQRVDSWHGRVDPYVIDEPPGGLGEVVRKFVVDVGDPRLGLIVGAFEWSAAGEQLVAENAHAPVVHLILILLVSDDLRREIVQRSARCRVPRRTFDARLSLFRRRQRVTYIVSA